MTNKPKAPTEIDAYIGKQIKKLRQSKNMKLKMLASKIGTSYQQLQKIENGQNRIPASRLYAIAKVFGVDIGYFFAHMPDNDSDSANSSASHPTDEEMDILILYNKLSDDLKEQFRGMLEAMVEAKPRKSKAKKGKAKKGKAKKGKKG